MTPTVLGLVLFPFALRFAGDGERLLQLALVAAVFEAGAAVVIGGFGLQLGLVPVLMFLLYVASQYLLGMRYPGEGAALRLASPLLLMLAYAVASALLLPDVFAGKVIVWPQKPVDALAPEPVPLAPGAGNLTQALYFGVNVALCMATALYLMRSGQRGWRRVLVAYMAGGYVVVAIAFWQLGARVAGLPFPDTVLYSNPSWAVVEQSMGAVPRIQGPFTEPAGLAVYMAGMAFCCLGLCTRGHIVMRPRLMLLLAVLTTCLSTSTTGIAALAFGLPAALAYAALRGDAPGLRRAGTALGTVVGLGALALVPLFVLRPEMLDFVDVVVESTLDKSESDSFVERQMFDELAWNAALASGGLGIGWGSTRSSSLLPGLLAGGGVFSVVMALWLGIGIVRRLGRARAVGPAGHPARAVVDGFAYALLGQLLAALISAPTIVTPIFFLQIGAVIAGVARLEIDGVAKRPTPVRILPLAADRPSRLLL